MLPSDLRLENDKKTVETDCLRKTKQLPIKGNVSVRQIHNTDGLYSCAYRVRSTSGVKKLESAWDSGTRL